MSHPLRQIASSWFVDVSAVLVRADGSRLGLRLEAMHAHGGTFLMDSDPAADGLGLGAQAHLEFRKADTGTAVGIKSWVTSVQPQESLWRVGVAFLNLMSHTASGRRHSTEGTVLPCPTDYPPLAWSNHPFFENTRLQFHVTGFFRNGMTLSFRKEVKPPIEDLPLELTLILPGLESLTARAKVTFVDLNDGESLSRCDVEFVEPSVELLSAIGRYLFTATDDLSVESLEALGYPVPEFEYASRFRLAQTEGEIDEMMALRLLAYQTRTGANLAGVTEPNQMRDKFDDHSLILSVRVGSKVVGTGRIVFNDGDRSKSEIGKFVQLPDWLWEQGFVECSRVATAPGIRRRDVFSTISKHTLRIAYQAGVRYILADCEAHLLEPYKKRGARELGLQFVHPLEGKTLHVIHSNVAEILAALESRQLHWKTMWSPAGPH